MPLARTAPEELVGPAGEPQVPLPAAGRPPGGWETAAPAEQGGATVGGEDPIGGEDRSDRGAASLSQAALPDSGWSHPEPEQVVLDQSTPSATPAPPVGPEPAVPDQGATVPEPTAPEPGGAEEAAPEPADPAGHPQEADDPPLAVEARRAVQILNPSGEVTLPAPATRG